MANRDFRKNLLLALGALGSIFGGIQKTSGIDAVTLYNQSDNINYYDYKDKWTNYEEAVKLMSKLLKEKVVPTSRKNQSLNHISTDLAKAKFLKEAATAIFNYAKSFDCVSEDYYNKGAPKYNLNKIKANAQLLKKLGDSWNWPKGNYVWKNHKSWEKEYSDWAKTYISSVEDHIDNLFKKYDNPLTAREKKQNELEAKGYSDRSIAISMADYDKIHHPIFGIINPEDIAKIKLLQE